MRVIDLTFKEIGPSPFSSIEVFSRMQNALPHKNNVRNAKVGGWQGWGPADTTGVA